MKVASSLILLLALAASSCCGGSGTSDSCHIRWGDTGQKYLMGRTDYPECGAPFENDVWKGETVNAVALLSSDEDMDQVTVGISRPAIRTKSLPEGAVSATFVDYVTADVIDTASYGQCGYRKKGQYDSLRVADIISDCVTRKVSAGEVRPIWITIKVPQDAKCGAYRGKLLVRGPKCRMSLPFEFRVVDKELPNPSEWSFHLDLWQNPYAVARYFRVEPWSEEHFARMRPVMELLASAGQKAVTATILDKPWNGQTYDAFGSMVRKVVDKKGNWTYDYSIFDKWVEFMESVGIDSQINCYSMIPWSLKFDYIEKETGRAACLEANPTSKEFRNYWKAFLQDFAKHLKEKGWFDRTRIAMDERPVKAMMAALELIHSVEPDFKVSLTGNYHEEMDEYLSNMCIPFGDAYPEGVCEARRSQGKTSTFYTCCAEAFPNTYLASPPYEASWLPWYALATGCDGYLRWAYNSWTEDPMNDTRFRRWPAGDCFIVYPEGRSSVRMQKLIEGIQDYEKAKIMIDEWIRTGNQDKYAAFNELLNAFSFEELKENGGERAIRDIRKLL